MKKLLIIVMAMLLLTDMARAQFTFTTNSGAITITGYNPAAGLNVVIPASTNGYPVVQIGADAFYEQTTITNVTIPNSVTNIGDYAFEECFGLTSVTIPNSVTSIGDEAFEYCSGLTNVTIGSGVTSIGDEAFSDCSRLTSVTIPNSVTSIGDVAFSDCSGLTNIAVNAANPNYASVGGVLFDKPVATLIQYADGLKGNYTIPNSVTSIGDDAFFGCSGLTSVTIGSGVTSIGDYAFSYCSGLTSVTIGSGVTSIGDDAFFGCSGLTSVTIPNSVTSIGDEAFSDCSGLTNIAVNAANPNYASVGGVLFDKPVATLIQYADGLKGNYTIPNSVTSIGDEAFDYCSGLTSVTIGSGVTSIGDEAFSVCSGLTSVTIPNSVTNIGGGAFELCFGLTNAYFQGNAPSVDGGAGSANTTVFHDDTGTAYYIPGTLNWGSTFGGWPTRQKYQPQPQILPLGPGFGVSSNQFNFIVSWATNASVVVLASTNLQTWTPLITNTLVSGTSAFADSTWTNYPCRFYRVQAQ